jgi:cysteinyl-tRNA synthetase
VLYEFEIERMVRDRDLLRTCGNFPAADRLRQEIESIVDGMYRISLIDEPTGTFWYWTALKPK